MKGKILVYKTLFLVGMGIGWGQDSQVYPVLPEGGIYDTSPAYGSSEGYEWRYIYRDSEPIYTIVTPNPKEQDNDNDDDGE